MPSNECIAYYDSGEDLTGQATAAITGRRFLTVSGAKQIGSQALATDTFGGSILVAHSAGAAGVPIIGVSAYDCSSGFKLPIIRGKKVVPVEAGAAMTAGQRVASDSVGRAVTYTAAADASTNKVPAGIVLNSPTAAGQTAIVALDL